MKKTHQWNLSYFAIAFVVLTLVQFLFIERRVVQSIPYSQFLQLLSEQKVSDLRIEKDQISGKLQEPIDGRLQFSTVRVDPALASDLAHSGVGFTGINENTFLSGLLGWLLPFVLIMVVWHFLFRGLAEKQGMGGLMSIGKSRAKVFVQRDTGVTFADVAGIDEAKAELVEIVSFLKDKAKYSRLGAHIPKGTLLVGPPGTGKTLVAKAIAGEAGVPFFSISGSEFVEMFVGVGAARVHDLFEQAREAAPCIIFIDELDALGKMRGVGAFGGNDEKEQTLNQLLAELDGFDPREGVVLLAATNRPEILDPALLRAGRIDRQLLIDRPDRKGRQAILKVHLQKIVVEPTLDSEQIADITTGFTGADLANLVNEAAIVATRRGADAVNLADFTAAVERIVAGVERKSSVLRADERQVVAYHEMGHALAASSLPAMDPVHKVSIVPRAIGSLGYTLQRPTEDHFLISCQMLKDRIAVLMAGRAAEFLAYGQISTGAADDLARATDIARQLLTRFGMSAELGLAVLERKTATYLGDSMQGVSEKDYSEQTAREIDLGIRALLDEAYTRAKALLQSRRTDLDAGARLLLEKETLTPEEFPPLQPMKPVLTLPLAVTLRDR
ncbi:MULTISPECIES: ATP-dependent zinc metalloprotease FtsH [Pseudomonas]|jgi:cell division protease FtsH|uniref:ATP-dependent zinc metalloprotease FtsH n=2 Tax=Pseudomonas mandelii TaxID=75612 RepID=A0AB36CWT4_9PSED|nr:MULTISPECIES: ATP-dependent zinc metalloprotease FtsH [Pseudomonas]MBA4360716.1 ATP-dependent metallopeptidase FtsH/Yme1/Tma family protein [Pseudomonas sp.]MBU0526434.1 ATP-dependent zinc metalloprotease FtsH [Gammaproteobacteria bacterium]AHZ68015.1 ATP-dependent metalloprotease FtsH [Pseudomonas mandelii JR-1]MBU0819307.1 ATP-dependent zinc metalloprotease FtsH [Gammaproteobacteria bacterium]MBU0839643.1 ATP-dependent zinc metalloprotease FtsH [Gammaproteobacteria bacterium]